MRVRDAAGKAASTQVMGPELFCAVAMPIPVIWLLTYTNHDITLIMRGWWKLSGCPPRLLFPVTPQMRRWG